MALVAKTLTLDITPGAIPQVVNVSEYDENREYTVTLIDDGGTFTIPSGTTATIEGTIGGNGFSESATVSGNTITFALTESMTAYAGDAWVKIKLTKDGKPVQTAAFILRCDKAGAEADTIINSAGFQGQINQGVAEYLDDHQPFFTLPEGGQSGQALLSDGDDGAQWGDIAIELDATLSQQGEAADAAATGTAIATAKTQAISGAVSELTEPGGGSAVSGNIVDPSNVKNGFYYDSTGTLIENSDYLCSENKIPIDPAKGAFLFGMVRATFSNVYWGVQCYNGETALGSAYSSINQGSTSVQKVVLRGGTNAIRVYCRTYGRAVDPSDLCIMQESFETFEEYGGGAASSIKIKDSLIDTDGITDSLTEQIADSNNLLDPENFGFWGYGFDLSTGETTTSGSNVHALTTKNKIYVGASTATIHFRIRTPLSTNYGEGDIFCYAGDTFLGSVRSFNLTTSNSQSLSLRQGTTHIKLMVTGTAPTQGRYINNLDCCLSIFSLPDFEEFSYSRKIKSELLPDGSSASFAASKRSSLYQKNVVQIGDSIMNSGTITRQVGQMVGAEIYNASTPGASMGKYQQGYLSRWWFTGANLAACIASGNWQETLAGIAATSETYTATALERATHLSQLDWSTVDLLIFALGANDGATDDTENPKNTGTYAGAARYVIETLLSAYPNLRIAFISPIYSSTYGMSGVKDKLKGVCEEYNMPFIDNYSSLGINSVNAASYLIDGLHPNAKGEQLMIDHIAQELW